MYQIRILPEASRELNNLGKSVARRIVERIHWLASNLGVIRVEALKGDIDGFYKLRVGEYRVI